MRSRFIVIVLIILSALCVEIWWQQSRTVPIAPVPKDVIATLSGTASSPVPAATPSAKPIPSPAFDNPSGSPCQVIISSGEDILASASLRAGKKDAKGIWQSTHGQAAWYSEPGYPEPGASSTKHRAIITAHVTHSGKPDVFWNLRDVLRGDIVTVTYCKGTKVVDTAVFRVTQNPEGFTKQAMQQADSYWDVTRASRELTLITCDQGSVLRADGHRSGNLAVKATRIA